MIKALPSYSLASSAYWDSIASERRCLLWRSYMDQVNRDLVSAWTRDRRFRRVLKTDAFDEAVGEGVTPALRTISGGVHELDLSFAAIRTAAVKNAIAGAQADVRRLPFAEGSFDLVVSLSTLDHFVEPRL